MNDVKNKLSMTVAVIIGIWLISYALSNILEFEKTTAGNKIVIIPIRGEITSEGVSTMPFAQTTTSSSMIINFIEQAEKDESVKGIILEIDSGGGTVVASKEVADFVKKTKKPTVALIRDVGASGAYWIASAADKIVADDMSITGSIGVTASYLEFAELMEKYGITYEELKSGEYKETGSPFRKLTAEERRVMQEKIDKIEAYFLEDIKKNRELDEKTVQELKKGGIYLGIESYDLKLIDYLGDKELAVNITKELANIKEAKVVRYEEKRGILDILGRLSTEAFYNIGRGIGAELLYNQRIRNPLEIRS